jgi:hypothetical protein
MYIIIKGDPVDGFEYIGPFDNSEAAEDFMDTISNDATWSIKLQSPTDTEDDAA